MAQLNTATRVRGKTHRNFQTSKNMTKTFENQVARLITILWVEISNNLVVNINIYHLHKKCMATIYNG